MGIEKVKLPLTGAGDSTADVAVDTTPEGDVQVIKLAVSADGSSLVIPADVDGLFVQAIVRTEDPQDDLLISTNLAAGGNVDLDAADIPIGKTGRLMAVDLGSTVPLRCDIQLVNGSRVTRSTIYSNACDSKIWRNPSPTFFELVGGLNIHYGVSITNLSPNKTADVRATIYWDQV